MVRPMAKALEYDRSLLERLYTDPDLDIPRTMLDVKSSSGGGWSHSDVLRQVQYRFPAELAAFPSATFYEGRLRTGTEVTPALVNSAFPWPQRDGRPFPVVFVPCSTEEDMGGSSKSNEGQARLVAHIVHLLRTPKDGETEVDALGITALTPYTKQAKALRAAIPSGAEVQAYTIDSFQGREDDVIVFSTVRCNVYDEIGFVEDARRL
jgi:superfamily I DNA and/or RNA helicase